MNEANSIIIGNNCSIADNVNFVIDQNHNYISISTFPWNVALKWDVGWKLKVKGQIIIEHDVWLARNTTIRSGVTIGNGAVVGANSFVAKDVPPYAIVGGNPAKIIKYRFPEEQIIQLNKIKWWLWDNDKMLQTNIGLTKKLMSLLRSFIQK
jgi:virginiamycin A acetyltransferase